MGKTCVRRLPDDGIQLVGDSLQVVVYPKFGGKIVSLLSHDGSKEWLWTNPNMILKQTNIGTPYDDNFYGGIDYLFPNDFPTCVEGYELPDHGELWASSWNYTIFQNETVSGVRMTLDLKTVPVEVEYSLWIDGCKLFLEGRFINTSDYKIPYLWVIHPSFQIGPDFRIHIPGGSLIVDDEINGRISKGVTGIKWPGTDIGVDLSSIPPKHSGMESYFILNLPEGRFRIEDMSKQVSLEVKYSLDTFPYLWLFLPLGGWRDHYVAVIEPSSGYPSNLSEALKNNTCSTLVPHGSIKSTIVFSVF